MLLFQYNQILLLISLSAHVLVCFNSAANPLLYALINRQLRAQHVQAMARKRQSITAATQVVLEFVIQATNKLDEMLERMHSFHSSSLSHLLIFP